MLAITAAGDGAIAPAPDSVWRMAESLTDFRQREPLDNTKMYPEPLKALAQAWTLMGDQKFGASLKDTYSRAGYLAVLREEINHSLRQCDQGQWAKPISIAEDFVVLGDTSNALKWLEKGYEEHSSSMQYIAGGAGVRSPRVRRSIPLLGWHSGPASAESTVQTSTH